MIVSGFDIALILAGIFVTIGMVGSGYNLLTRRVTSVRRPLTLNAFVISVALELIFIDYLVELIWNLDPISGPPSQILFVISHMAMGSLLVLKQYTDRREHSQVIKFSTSDHLGEDGSIYDLLEESI